jgi:hypothetical protein
MPKGLPGMEPGQEQALDQGMPGPEEQMTLPQQDSDNLMELTGQAEPEGEMPLMPPMSEEEMVMAEQQAPQEQMPPISEEEAMMMEQQMAEERV